MKPKEREVVILRYIQDLEYSEVAKILGKKEGAIRTHLSRSLKNFEKLYKELYPLAILFVTILIKLCIHIQNQL